MIIGRTVDLGEERRKQALYAAELRQQIAERDHARRGGAEPEAAAREGPIQTPFPGLSGNAMKAFGADTELALYGRGRHTPPHMQHRGRDPDEMSQMGRRGRGGAHHPESGPGEWSYQRPAGGAYGAVARSPPRQEQSTWSAGPEAQADGEPTSPSSPHARFSYSHLNPEEKTRVDEERRKREEMKSVLEQQIEEKRRQKDAERQRREDEERREEERVRRQLAELAAEQGSPAPAHAPGPWDEPHSDGRGAGGGRAATSPPRDEAPAGFGLRRTRARHRAPSFDNAAPRGGGGDSPQREPRREHQREPQREPLQQREPQRQEHGHGAAHAGAERRLEYGNGGAPRGDGPAAAHAAQGPAGGEWGGRDRGSQYPPPSFAPRRPFPPWSHHALRGAGRGYAAEPWPAAAAGGNGGGGGGGGGNGALDALRRELAQGRDALTAQIEAQQQVMGALNAEVQRVRAERAALERQRRAYETMVGEMGRGGGTSALGKAGQRLAASQFRGPSSFAHAPAAAPMGSGNDDDPALDSLNARSEWIEAGARPAVMQRQQASAADGGSHFGGAASVVTSPSGAFRVSKGIAAPAGHGIGHAQNSQWRPGPAHGAGPNLSDLDEALMDFVERKQGWNTRLHAVAGR